MSVALNACEGRDFHDELRQAKTHARYFLDEARPTKTAIAHYLARHFETALGVHGTGYAAAPTGFGGVKWHYCCPSCERRVQRLFRPLGSKRWACRWCCGVGRIRGDRGWRWGERLVPLIQELDAYRGRRGRRPARYHRLVRELSAMVTAGQLILT
jgi:hypothetical protein